jgi:hypothetical protein
MNRCAGSHADDIRAMPSALALLVASLLTEPPYGCLGPSGNDRYRRAGASLQQPGRGYCLGSSDRENTTAGRRDKRGSPAEPQAIDLAWVRACRSVGARAAPCVLMSAIKVVFGTVCAYDCWEALL